MNNVYYLSILKLQNKPKILFNYFNKIDIQQMCIPSIDYGNKLEHIKNNFS